MIRGLEYRIKNNKRKIAKTCLDKGVDGQDAKLWVGLGVVHEVEIDQLLLLQVVCLHVLDHVGEQRADILANGHGSNNLLDGLLPLRRVL